MGQKAGYIAILLISVVLIYLFAARGMRFFLVPSSSMEPTLFPTDYIITLEERRYERGDIVVINDTEAGDYLVKRIAGIGGDVVMVGNHALYVNGRYASEPYIAEPMKYSMKRPVEVPREHVFVLGDNRNFSEDSSMDLKTWPVDDIVGRVCFIYYPYAHFGPVRSFPLARLPGG